MRRLTSAFLSLAALSGALLASGIVPGGGVQTVQALPLAVPIVPPPEAFPVEPASDSYWSDPLAWGGVKPGPGDIVLVGSGVRLLLDEDTPALGGVLLRGTLEFEDAADVALTS